MAAASVTSATTAEDWAFLRPWFAIVEGRVIPHTHGGGYADDSDAVRIGHDPTTDFWLQVVLEREDVLQQHEQGERAALQELHEAIVLVHLLGSVNYELWYEWMVTRENLFPPAWFIPQNAKIPLRYMFEFDGECDADFVKWDTSLAFLCRGGAPPSSDFVRDLQRTQELMARHGVKWEDVESVPIMLRVHNPSGSTHLVLKHLADAVKQMEVVNAQAAQQESSHIGRGAVFKVTSLELDLSGTSLYHELLPMLQRCLELGVPIDYLRLPELGAAQHFGMDRAGFNERSRFMRVLLGVASNHGTGEWTQVRHLVLPISYVTMRWFVPFCSALVSSRFLHVLHLKSSENEDFGGASFGDDDGFRRPLWSWLAFALFSSASTSSVETFILDGESLRTSDVEAIQAVVESEDPLAFLCGSTHSDVCDHTSVDTRPTVLVNLGGFLRVQDGSSDDKDSIGLRRSEVVAHVLHPMKENASHAHVFAPGFGFREAKISSAAKVASPNDRPTKLQRIETLAPPAPPPSFGGPQFRTLRLKTDQPHESASDALLHLVRLVGRRVRGLGIDFVDRSMGEDTLNAVFASCPHLESFAISRVQLDTMHVFRQAYDQHRLPLSSLKLTAVSVPENHLRLFLRALLQCNTMETTLQRLSVGSSWPKELSSETLGILKSILDHNKTLTHVVAYVSSEQYRNSWRLLGAYHGAVVDGLSYTERDRRMAFLGGMRHVASVNPSVHLDDNAKDLVLQFAAASAFRRSVGWYSTRVGTDHPVYG